MENYGNSFQKEKMYREIVVPLHANNKTTEDMSIDTYKLTSMEEPTDEVLSQLMKEAAEDASKSNSEATTRFFEEIKQAAAIY